MPYSDFHGNEEQLELRFFAPISIIAFYIHISINANDSMLLVLLLVCCSRHICYIIYSTKMNDMMLFKTFLTMHFIALKNSSSVFAIFSSMPSSSSFYLLLYIVVTSVCRNFIYNMLVDKYTVNYGQGKTKRN